MSVTEIMRNRLKEAMKANKEVEKNILRLAISEIAAQASRGVTVNEDEEHRIIRKLITSNEEFLTAISSEESERSNKLREEITILQALLPRTLTRVEIHGKLASMVDNIKSAKSDGQATGLAIKFLKQEKATFSGEDVASIVKEFRL